MATALAPDFDAAALLARLRRAPRRITADSRQVRAGRRVRRVSRDSRPTAARSSPTRIARGAGAVLWEALALPLESPRGASPTSPVDDLKAQARRDRRSHLRQPVAARCGSSASPAPTARRRARTGSRSASTPAAGARAVIGTLGNGLVGALEPSAHTTPDAARVHEMLARLRDAGAQAVAMEVSSHGLDQGRVNGVEFDVALFTNLTRDHLDYHGTMAAYGAAKAKLFAWPTARTRA